ncbi:hypothetical protein Clacol_002081 [Clathrus columnatus]|uniref:Uncharacterized protein n=1 Tax=Clathrus columnatus TaxID=1419009 RepID=A0AAV5A0U6_9AGAM|nr:hypothetical protein Clacol_002081 [Clathrus columnatus]
MSIQNASQAQLEALEVEQWAQILNEEYIFLFTTASITVRFLNLNDVDGLASPINIISDVFDMINYASGCMRFMAGIIYAIQVPSLNGSAPLFFRIGDVMWCRLAITITQSLSVLVFDTFVFLGTAYKTYGIWKLQREVGSSDRSITDIIVRQGVIRYSYVVLLTLGGVILRQTTVTLVLTEVTSLIQQAVSPMLVCRLTLELRERYEIQIDEVVLPTLTWSFQGVRQGVRYVHDTIIAEAAGELGSYDDDSSVEDTESFSSG